MPPAALAPVVPIRHVGHVAVSLPGRDGRPPFGTGTRHGRTWGRVGGKALGIGTSGGLDHGQNAGLDGLGEHGPAVNNGLQIGV